MTARNPAMNAAYHATRKHIRALPITLDKLQR
jgi:CO/xanthine dehydrogenase Mo-binding subunit